MSSEDGLRTFRRERTSSNLLLSLKRNHLFPSARSKGPGPVRPIGAYLEAFSCRVAIDSAFPLEDLPGHQYAACLSLHLDLRCAIPEGHDAEFDMDVLECSRHRRRSISPSVGRLACFLALNTFS